jgi:hypothetical protein
MIMKKVFALIIGILLFASVSFAGDPAMSSGLKTSDGIISASRALVYGVTVITNTTNVATLVLYDSASAASGTELAKIAIPAGTSAVSVHVPFDNPIDALSGIYADITGTSAAYVVYFKIK